MFGLDRDKDGSLYLPRATRYLGFFVEDMCESHVIRDTAFRLGMVARDLETLVFYVYCNFNLACALNPPPVAVETVSVPLCGKDGEKILEASYLIYHLRRFEDNVRTQQPKLTPDNDPTLIISNVPAAEAEQAREALNLLLTLASSMSITGQRDWETQRVWNYSLIFGNETARLRVALANLYRTAAVE